MLEVGCTILEQCNVVNSRMLANCCAKNYTTCTNNLGVKNCQMSAFKHAFIHIKYSSNMAAWFYVQFDDVTAAMRITRRLYMFHASLCHYFRISFLIDCICSAVV